MSNNEEEVQLFLSGLPYETTNDSLEAWLEEHLGTEFKDISQVINYINLQFYQDTHRCRGYGHITIANKDYADKILQIMNKKILKDRYIDFSHAKGKSNPTNLKRKRDDQDILHLENATTLFVKNLPYESTEDDIGDYFSKFGKVKFVRKVQKDGGKQHFKGIAYVEFVGNNAVKKCLKSTHTFASRSLVVDIEGIGKKAGQREKKKGDGNSKQCYK